MFQDYNIAVLLSIYKNDKVEFLRLSIDSILNQSYKNIILYIGVDNVQTFSQQLHTLSFGARLNMVG